MHICFVVVGCCCCLLFVFGRSEIFAQTSFLQGFRKGLAGIGPLFWPHNDKRSTRWLCITSNASKIGAFFRAVSTKTISQNLENTSKACSKTGKSMRLVHNIKSTFLGSKRKWPPCERLVDVGSSARNLRKISLDISESKEISLASLLL